ncbi:MAG: hypothetical protein K8F92_16835 [Hyphomicrobium sp.]|uniref:hypothetical protein n=1 Tax=Hyphomicrobium sp. TaxID=82 RepID=UPI001324DB9C|nr:hypothetical protein [Hyphomicrobium sp.]KAB2939746.1 MAG: hypothetical protein F9K20_15725 [Hyphomicrobium sp.]MBZ0211299.1 hypothetical protein [Hyphomicrobium sp.]
MVLARLLLLVVMGAAQLGDAVLAAPPIFDQRDPSPILEPVQRKGTRNYRPDGTTPGEAATASQAPTVSREAKLKQCMDTWDEGTHITKSKWREICLRQLDARE